MANKTSLKRFRNSDLISDYWKENGHRCELTPYLSDIELAEVKKIRKTNIDKGRELHLVRGSAGF